MVGRGYQGLEKWSNAIKTFERIPAVHKRWWLEGMAEIAAQDAAGPLQILNENRSIQTVLLSQRFCKLASVCHTALLQLGDPRRHHGLGECGASRNPDPNPRTLVASGPTGAVAIG